MLTLKRWGVVTLVFAVVIACALPAAADVETWAPPSEPLLRLAMESLEEDWDDAGEMALLAAALPALAAIPPEARAAFAQAHGLDAATVDRAYYRLLGAALAADLRLYPYPEETYRMTQERLLALLSDAGARQTLTEAEMLELAAAYALPVDFLRYLVAAPVYFGYADDWYDDDWYEDWDDDWYDDGYGIGEGHYKGRGEGHDKDGDGIDDHFGVIIREGGRRDEEDEGYGKPEQDEKDKKDKQGKKDDKQDKKDDKQDDKKRR